MTERITLAEYQRAESKLRTEHKRIGFIVHTVACHERRDPAEGTGDV